MIKRRDISLDMISGFLIILIILYHAAQWSGLSNTATCHKIVYAFFYLMPWFYFKAGYFHNAEHSFKKTVKTSLTPLILILILGSIIGLVIMLPGTIRNGGGFTEAIVLPVIQLFKQGAVLNNPPLWFILSLFFVKLIIFVITKFNDKIIVASTLIFAFLGFFQHYYWPDIAIGAHKALPIGVSFSLFGFIYKKHALSKVLKQLNLITFIATIFSAMLFTSYVHVHFNELRIGYYWVYIVNSALAIISLVWLAPKLVWKPMCWVGKRTLIFFVIHWPIFYITFYICRILNWPLKGWIFFLILSVSAVIGSVILAKFITRNHILKLVTYIFLVNKANINRLIVLRTTIITKLVNKN